MPPRIQQAWAKLIVTSSISFQGWLRAGGWRIRLSYAQCTWDYNLTYEWSCSFGRRQLIITSQVFAIPLGSVQALTRRQLLAFGKGSTNSETMIEARIRQQHICSIGWLAYIEPNTAKREDHAREGECACCGACRQIGVNLRTMLCPRSPHSWKLELWSVMHCSYHQNKNKEF